MYYVWSLRIFAALSATSDRINAALAAIGRTRYWLHRQTGMPYASIHSICGGTTDPRASTVDRIMQAIEREAATQLASQPNSEAESQAEQPSADGAGAASGRST